MKHGSVSGDLLSDAMSPSCLPGYLQQSPFAEKKLLSGELMGESTKSEKFVKERDMSMQTPNGEREKFTLMG